MKTATVSDLSQDFPRIEAWVQAGESIRISKNGRVIALLVPPPSSAAQIPAALPRSSKPDIMARLRETWGDRVFNTEEVSSMRAAELAGDPG